MTSWRRLLLRGAAVGGLVLVAACNLILGNQPSNLTTDEGSGGDVAGVHSFGGETSGGSGGTAGIGGTVGLGGSEAAVGTGGASSGGIDGTGGDSAAGGASSGGSGGDIGSGGNSAAGGASTGGSGGAIGSGGDMGAGGMATGGNPGDCVPGEYVEVAGTPPTCATCPLGLCSTETNAASCSFAQMAAGNGHTCALLTNGHVRCWGWALDGRLGYGNADFIGDDEVASVAGDVDVGGTVIQLAAGDEHTCALLSGGKVRCWGEGDYGRLGYGNEEDVGDDETPANAGDVNVGGTVVQVAAGGVHTCALLTTGKVRCWGLGGYAELGYGNSNNIGDGETPASAGDVDVGGPVVQISTGYVHTCARLTTGAVRCWGSGSDGRLGYGNQFSIGDNEAPATAGDVNVGGAVAEVVAANTHTCARLETGSVRCWGDGAWGKLGYANTDDIGDNETPASAGDVDVGGPAVQISAGSGSAHTCALLADGGVRCWGLDQFAALGNLALGNIGDDETPASAPYVDIGATVTQLSVGSSAACALLTDANARCWGWGNYGQLGYGSTAWIGESTTPASWGNVPFR